MFGDEYKLKRLLNLFSITFSIPLFYFINTKKLIGKVIFKRQAQITFFFFPLILIQQESSNFNPLYRERDLFFSTIIKFFFY